MEARIPMGVVVGLLAFYLIGFGVLGYGLYSAWRSTQAAAWPTTPGTITSLELKESFDADGSSYGVRVQYAYTLDGEAYEGNRVAFGYADDDRRGYHAELHRRMKEAKVVNVRYDPANPARSCLSFGVHRSIRYVLFFAAAWLAAVTGFAILTWVGMQADSVLLENLSVQ